MTREEAIKMAKADLKCMERDTSGQDEMCNSHKCDECSLNYERGNMGEQKEWLRMAIKALEQESMPTIALPDIDKKVESYKELLKHPVIKHIMDMDETQEQLDFVQPHKRIPVRLSVSENPNNCDLISRKALISHIENQSRKWGEDYDAQQILGDIEDIPSVKPQEPKTVLYSGDGYADGEMVYDMANCPNCGREFEDGDETWGCNFCPDCGQALRWKGANEYGKI